MESSLAMSDTRSPSPLSAADYDAIAAAVMETGRGRWFLAEYARRNRQADTEMVLSAIARLERLCTLPAAAGEPNPDLSETARTIAELRDDLLRAIDEGLFLGRGMRRVQGRSPRLLVWFALDARAPDRRVAWDGYGD